MVVVCLAVLVELPRHRPNEQQTTARRCQCRMKNGDVVAQQRESKKHLRGIRSASRECPSDVRGEEVVLIARSQQFVYCCSVDRDEEARIQWDV